MNWPTKALGELVSFYSGGTPSKSNSELWSGSVPWFSPKDMKRRSLWDSLDHISERAFTSSALRAVPAGTVALVVRGMILAHTVPISILEVDSAINQDIKALIPKTEFDARYLAEMLRAQHGQILAQVSSSAHGTRKIDTRVLEALRIPWPPLPEQRRVAAILDHADALRTKRRESLTCLDTLTKSIFDDTFGDVRINPRDFATTTVGDVATLVTDGEHQTPKREPVGSMLLSARNIQQGRLDLRNVDYIGNDELARIRKRCAPTEGDILISCSGSIGRVATVPKMDDFALVRSVALLRFPRELVLPSFAEAYLRSDFMQSIIARSAHASSQANLFQAPIKRLPLLLPPLQLQRQFEEDLARVAKVLKSICVSSGRLELLFDALQHRAFQGGL